MAVLGIVYGSIALVMTIALFTWHFRRMQARRLSSQLIHEMLQRKLQPDEIERILALWAGNRRLAKKILGQDGGKPEFEKPEFVKPQFAKAGFP